jgi:tetratricopeptide (TPR) repeat protein
MLGRLDQPIPALDGVDASARAALAVAEDVRERVEADYDRRPGAWPTVERDFRRIANRLSAAHDPFSSSAWLGVGRSTRYQKGRRDDTIHAFIESLYWDRSNLDAWLELVDMASSAPHIPTLLEIFSKVPFAVRGEVLRSLLIVSYGQDRLGNMPSVVGAKLRDELLTLAEFQRDRGTVATLAGKAGLAAEKAGDLDTAVEWWRRAVAAGSTDENVADRFSTWLAKRHEFREAELVLRQGLGTEPQSATVADRLRRRLARCERSLSE